MGIKIIMRSLGVYFWIPILINDIIIPSFVLLIKLNGTEENVTQGVMILSQMFTPFLSAFWTYMYLEKYIDMKGNECFYIVRKNKWPEIMWLLFLYVVTNTIPFGWYISMGKKYFYEWIHIVIICFLFVSAAYCLSYLLKSISLAMIPSFIYLLASVTGLNDALKKISFYESNTGMEPSKLLTRYNYFIVAAIVIAVIGRKLNDNYENYCG